MDGEATPERVLIITAHPDDVDFGAAGSVATWTDAGIDVTYCIVTDGDAGGFDRAVARHVMAETRRAEQTAAAKTVGVTDLVFLEHYLEEFAGKHPEYDEAKWLDIIGKTWKKMSERAHRFVLDGGISLPGPLAALVHKAVAKR